VLPQPSALACPEIIERIKEITKGKQKKRQKETAAAFFIPLLQRP
jgi:hypothetical protein